MIRERVDAILVEKPEDPTLPVLSFLDTESLVLIIEKTADIYDGMLVEDVKLYEKNLVKRLLTTGFLVLEYDEAGNYYSTP